MKKILIGLTLLASMSSFANTVEEIQNKLSTSICGKNFPQSDKEYQTAIEYALAAELDVYTVEDKQFENGIVQPATVLSGRIMSRYIDLMLRAEIQNRDSLSTVKVSVLESFCDSLKTTRVLNY